MKGITTSTQSAFDTETERTALRDLVLCEGVFMPRQQRADYVSRQLHKLSDACVLRHLGNRIVRTEGRRRNLV